MLRLLWILAATVSAQETPSVVEPPVILQQPAPTNAVLAAMKDGDVLLRVTAGGTPPFDYQWRQNGILRGVQPAFQFESGSRGSARLTGLYSVVLSNPAGSVTSSIVSLAFDAPESEITLHPRGLLSGFEDGAGTGSPMRFQVRDNIAYVANGWSSALRILDISNPDRLEEIARAPIPNDRWPFDVALIDHYALIAERLNGLGIIDIENPAAPVHLGNFALPGFVANSITVRDRLAYIGNESAGLVIVDVNNPAQPAIVGRMSGPARANGFHLVGDRAYVANWNLGIAVIDVSDPAAPVELGAYPVDKSTYSGRAFDVFFAAPFAYIADSVLGLIVVDIQSVNNPQKVDSHAGDVWDVTVLGKHLFAADSLGGLRVFDVSNPPSPRFIGGVRHERGIIGALAYGNRLFMGGPTVALLDLKFPALAPVVTGYPEVRHFRAGRRVTLEIAAAGTEPLAYQWFRDGQDISDLTGPILTIPAATPEDAGDYTVVVSNSLGSATSRVARLVLAPATLRIDPESFHPAPAEVRFHVLAEPGIRFAVLVSDDLQEWREVVVRTAAAIETEIVDETPLAERRFYQLELRQ